VYDAGEVTLQSGVTLSDAKIAYQSYGTLAPSRDNLIIYPTKFGSDHKANEYLVGHGAALDTSKYLIVCPNLIGNGLSTSPSNAPEHFNRSRFPLVTIYDNVRIQRQLLRDVFDVERVALAIGASMGAIQAYQWAALFAEDVERLVVICGAARVAVHNYVFIEGMKAALMADAQWNEGSYTEQPRVGLRALARVWAPWGLSQAFYREGLFREMGLGSVEEFLSEICEPRFLEHDANDLLAQFKTWQAADISANSVFESQLDKALAAITADVLLMPGETDQYFPVEDNRIELEHLRQGELRPIPSKWGHWAGGDRDPHAVAFVERQVRKLLAGP
jgi:homoserine O-acetyltransferase